MAEFTTRPVIMGTFGVVAAGHYLAAAIGYLVVTLPLIRLVNAVESRLRSGLIGVAGGFGN